MTTSTLQNSEEDIGLLFLESLSSAFDIYGPGVSNLVFWKFEQETKLSRREIYLHPKEFVQSLRSIFGVGTALIERAIMRSIKQRIPSIDSLELVEALTRLRRYFSGISH